MPHPNTKMHVKLTLSMLTPQAKRILLAIKNKTPLASVSNTELTELFTKGILRQDYDVIGKIDVVLLTGLGKRLLDIVGDDPQPPLPPRPRLVPSGKRVHPKRKQAA